MIEWHGKTPHFICSKEDPFKGQETFQRVAKAYLEKFGTPASEIAGRPHIHVEVDHPHSVRRRHATGLVCAYCGIPEQKSDA